MSVAFAVDAGAGLVPGEVVVLFSNGTLRAFSPDGGEERTLRGGQADGAAASDQQGGVYAVDLASHRIDRIDLANGDVRTIWEELTAWPASDLDTDAGFVWISQGDLYRVDAGTGDWTAFDVPNGPRLAIASSGHAVFMLEATYSAAHVAGLQRFDPITGFVEDLLPLLITPFPLIGSYGHTDVAITPDGTVYVATSQGSIRRVDPVEQTQETIAGSGAGEGPALGRLSDLIAVSDDLLLALDTDSAAILRVDAITGDRALVSGAGAGSGPDLTGLIGIESDGSILARSARSILRVDPVTGDRNPVFATRFGHGAEGFGFGENALSIGRDILLATNSADDRDRERLIRVDAMTGEAEVLVVTPYRDLILDDRHSDDGMLWALGSEAEDGPRSLVRFDTDAGAAAIVVSGEEAGSGPTWSNPRDVVSGSAGIFVADAHVIYRVDPETGARSVLANSEIDAGEWYRAISFDPRNRLLAAACGRLLEFDTATGSVAETPTVTCLDGLSVAGDGTVYGIDDWNRRAGRIRDGEMDVAFVRDGVSTIAVVPEAGMDCLGGVALLSLGLTMWHASPRRFFR